MKTVVEIVEKSGEGLESLLGKRVLIMTAGYFYEGNLVGVNTTCIKLSDTSIVFDTGKFISESYQTIEKLHTDIWYIQTGLIESFGLSKKS